MIGSIVGAGSCFYLSKRRQMQLYRGEMMSREVVFTFQKEGRCNRMREVPFRRGVVFTFQKEGRCNLYQRILNREWVVFTFQKEGRCNFIIETILVNLLFLPFKKKADAT